MSGTIEVKPVSGQFVRDTELFGTMDVYLIIEIEKQKEKSKVLKNGGTKPDFRSLNAKWCFRVTQETVIA